MSRSGRHHQRAPAAVGISLSCYASCTALCLQEQEPPNHQAATEAGAGPRPSAKTGRMGAAAAVAGGKAEAKPGPSAKAVRAAAAAPAAAPPNRQAAASGAGAQAKAGSKAKAARAPPVAPASAQHAQQAQQEGALVRLTDPQLIGSWCDTMTDEMEELIWSNWHDGWQEQSVGSSCMACSCCSF
jgi:hypothetical protein